MYQQLTKRATYQTRINFNCQTSPVLLLQYRGQRSMGPPSACETTVQHVKHQKITQHSIRVHYQWRKLGHFNKRGSEALRLQERPHVYSLLHGRPTASLTFSFCLSLGRWRGGAVEVDGCTVCWQMPRSLPRPNAAHLLRAASVSAVDARRNAYGNAGTCFPSGLSPLTSHRMEHVCVCLQALGDRRHVQVSADMRFLSPEVMCEAQRVEWVFMCFCGSVDQSCVWAYVNVCVFREAGGVCPPYAPPIAAKRLATCSGIREHADYTHHNGDTQTQICPRPTKDTLTPDSITANRF